MLLAFASQKIVHDVRDEMAEFVVPLQKKIKDSLSRQGKQTIRSGYKAVPAKRGQLS